MQVGDEDAPASSHSLWSQGKLDRRVGFGLCGFWVELGLKSGGFDGV